MCARGDQEDKRVGIAVAFLIALIVFGVPLLIAGIVIYFRQGSLR